MYVHLEYSLHTLYKFKHMPSPLASYSLCTCTSAFSPPKVPFVCIDFCWNNEAPWHWKVRFLLPQSCLRMLGCCCHCCASHYTTGSIWRIAGNQRLENALWTHPSSKSSKRRVKIYVCKINKRTAWGRLRKCELCLGLVMHFISKKQKTKKHFNSSCERGCGCPSNEFGTNADNQKQDVWGALGISVAPLIALHMHALSYMFV